MNTEKDKRDSWESYGDYFKKRTANDATAETNKLREDWRDCDFDDCGKKDDGSWE